jgi:hypothetical protein
MSNINQMYPQSGKIIKSNGDSINIAEIISAVYDAVNGVLKTSTNIEVSDLQIGAVEIKDSTTDERAVVGTNGLHVDVQSTDSVFQGNKTLTGVADQLVADQACKNVTIQADPSNVANVNIGTSAIDPTNYMFILSPGSSITFTVKNVNLIYALGALNDKLSFGGEV